jgi:hypothetical protein
MRVNLLQGEWPSKEVKYSRHSRWRGVVILVNNSLLPPLILKSFYLPCMYDKRLRIYINDLLKGLSFLTWPEI